MASVPDKGYSIFSGVIVTSSLVVYSILLLLLSSYLMKKCNDVKDIMGNKPPSKNANHLLSDITSVMSVPNASQTGEVNSTHDLNRIPVSSISL